MKLTPGFVGSSSLSFKMFGESPIQRISNAELEWQIELISILKSRTKLYIESKA